MNRRRLAVLWLLSSAALAAITARLVMHWHIREEHPAAVQGLPESEQQFHDWVHRHLTLTPIQNSELHAAERTFAEQRRALRAALHSANDALRAAILRDQRNSPAVRAAADEVAAAQAALQKATLAHFFDMAAMLDPGQRGRLIQWIHDSLQPPP